MTPRLIQLSGAVVDLVYKVESVPQAGQEAIVNGFTMTPGGGYNAMVAARRFGLDAAYAGTLGTGPFAEIVGQALHAENIPHLRPNRLKSQDQGACVVLVDRHGERSFIASEGADGTVTDADLAALNPGPNDWLLLSGYALGYRASRDALTRWLVAHPSTNLFLDPSPLVGVIPDATRQAALTAALWISANAEEAAYLTGESTPAKSAQTLANARRPNGGAVVRDGANGCWIARKNQPAQYVPPYPVTPIDTNGAGDTHIGCFIAALAQSETPYQAALMANVAAALSTTQEGPATAPTKATVLAALAAQDPIQQRRRP